MIRAAVAFPVALAVGFAVRWAAPRLGAMDRPDAALKPHARPVPYLGGVAVGAGAAAALAWGGWPLPWAVAVAVFGVGLVGLADDVFRLPPAARLAAELGLGLVLAGWGIRATALPGAALAWTGAVLLFAATVNAVNMVDGMDGLAAGLAVISGVGVAMVAAGADRSSSLAIALAAASAGFLYHNLPPARLFLGDSGAYLLGGGLAVAVLAAGRTVPALAGAASCLGLYLLDLVLSVLRRTVGRVPVMVNDRGHIYDQLRARGLSVSECLAVSYAIHAVLGAIGLAAAALPVPAALATTGGAWALAVAGLFAGGFVSGRGAGPQGDRGLA
ncbi:MAG: undecaprenyl/decaprenyl-phosphate alpha-N-acetylglucosaminyl 1-phosphate transferase [Actinobacteria bacterium]|nr:undecaprenyl/decaprenyl-phosphate alpha-N-acetylglucosaminyl 1-phosphate transferase [Actinomycetota bacterium]